MGSIGAPEVLVVLVVALVVLGPTRLPEAARSVGKAFREFRRVTSGFQDELRGALEAEPETATTAKTPRETWVSTEEPASMSSPATTSSTSPHGDAPSDGEGPVRPEGGRDSS